MISNVIIRLRDSLESLTGLRKAVKCVVMVYCSERCRLKSSKGKGAGRWSSRETTGTRSSPSKDVGQNLPHVAVHLVAQGPTGRQSHGYAGPTWLFSANHVTHWYSDNPHCSANINIHLSHIIIIHLSGYPGTALSKASGVQKHFYHIDYCKFLEIICQ